MDTDTRPEEIAWTGIKIDPEAPWLKRYEESYARMVRAGEAQRDDTVYKIPRRTPYRRAKVIEAAPPRVVKEAKVYVIRSGDFVKIGWSTDVPQRLRKIATTTPAEITLLNTASGGWHEERVLHERFAEYRHHGEWFRIEGALADWIAAGFTPTLITAPDGGST